MNNNAKLWVKALRSGKYKQVTGQLKKDDSYCCLGVACEVAKQHGIIKTFVGARVLILCKRLHP